MAHIKIKKGLDIPIDGAPLGSIRFLPPSSSICLDFSPFHSIQPHLLVKPGDSVAIGQPLVEDKQNPGRFWVSPACGQVSEILRGPKRVLNGILIVRDGVDRHVELPSKEEIIPFLCQTGLINYFWMRPFHVPVRSSLLPRSIFVKALESAPFTPSTEMQIGDQSEVFQAGLSFLSKLARVYLISRKDFGSFNDVTHHTAEGPHPVSNPSLHIQLIDPIRKSTDVVWTIDAWGVLAIGTALTKNRLLTEKIISIAGTGFSEDLRGYYRAHIGNALDFTASGRILSGDPLMGKIQPFLGFFDSVCSSIIESEERQPLHFFRFFTKYFTFSKTYFSRQKIFGFTTHLHGEERPFIDSLAYDRVMPLKIPTVPLVKAIIAENFERAEALGLLEVAPEDFALSTFVCPSKVEMVEIVENGLHRFATDVLT